MVNAYTILVGRRRHRWKYNIKVCLDRNSGQDSSDLGCGPLAAPCEHGSEPSGSIKGRKFLD
jgi:hypothetical protein